MERTRDDKCESLILEISCSWENPPRCARVTGELNPVRGLKLSNGFYRTRKTSSQVQLYIFRILF
jgi:hypothetical protein